MKETIFSNYVNREPTGPRELIAHHHNVRPVNIDRISRTDQRVSPILRTAQGRSLAYAVIPAWSVMWLIGKLVHVHVTQWQLSGLLLAGSRVLGHLACIPAGPLRRDVVYRYRVAHKLSYLTSSYP